MMNEKESKIRKVWFCNFVSKKINNIIELKHIYSVINILLDEMSKDLMDRKKIKIYNFGTLELKKTISRPYHDISNGQILMSKGNNVAKFSLFIRIRNFIRKNLDIEKTFKNNL